MKRTLKFYLRDFDFKEKKIVYRNYNLKPVYLYNIIDLFLSNYIKHDNDKLTLYSGYLKKIYGCKYNYYLGYLMERGFIYLYKNYSVGKHSKIYALCNKIKDNIDNVSDKYIEMTNHEYSKTISYNIEENEINKRIISSLYKVKINYDKSISDIFTQNLEKNKLYSNINSIKKINNKEIYYNFDRYGRLHTNFTVLKRNIRNKYLTINDHKLSELDIKNSQPFFLYVYLKQNKFDKFDNFDKDVLSGTLYEKIMKSGNINDRNMAKKHIYSVLFGRNRDTKWNKIFKKLYPNVFEWIVNFKHKYKNYKILSYKLQNIESNFMFKQFIPKVLSSFPTLNFITIHDSIMFEERYYNDIKPLFTECLQKLSN